MRQIDLQEHRKSEPLPLSVSERDTLRTALPSLSVEPAPGRSDAYILTPGSTIGALDLGDVSVVVRPKLDMSRVVFLASYAMGAFKLQDEGFDFGSAPTLVEILALALSSSARQAFARGLLHGYRTEQEALTTVRGQIAISEQIRRRFDVIVPVEVRYDEFTDDILANRLVKAAANLLGQMRLDDPRSRDGLRWLGATLGNVTPVRFAPNRVPALAFDRLNEHYREVVALSRLILCHQTLELFRGTARASGFLINMNEVFQGFVTQALRESLGVTEHTLRSDDRLLPLIYLDRRRNDQQRRLPLRPDLTWWDSEACTFVGDAKYKRIVDERVPNADLFQILAYATALNLPGGLLVYAKGEAELVEYEVRHCGKRLEVATIDLAGSIEAIRLSIDRLAARVRKLRDEARITAIAA